MEPYQELLRGPPRSAQWADAVRFDRLDDRRACVDALFANILGVNDGFVEWCPNEDPPSREEALAWLWFIRPDLSDRIAVDASSELRELIERYGRDDLESWWKAMTA